MRPRDAAAVRDHLVDQPERLGFLGRHELVALDRRLDHVERLAGVLDIDVVEALAQAAGFPGLDLDVGRLALDAARGLVDHDPRIGQREALALGAGGQQQRAHRGGLADADGRDRRADVLHRVVDREARRHHAARRVDVERDVLLRVLRLEEQELGADQAGDARR